MAYIMQTFIRGQWALVAEIILHISAIFDATRGSSNHVYTLTLKHKRTSMLTITACSHLQQFALGSDTLHNSHRFSGSKVKHHGPGSSGFRQ